MHARIDLLKYFNKFENIFGNFFRLKLPKKKKKREREREEERSASAQKLDVLIKKKECINEHIFYVN